MISEKQWKLFKPIVFNGVYQLLPSAINLVLSLLVVNRAGSEVWGMVVSLQLYYYLTGAFVAWGNKDQLLLQFAKDPSGINQYWQTSFLSRMLLLLFPVLVCTAIGYQGILLFHLCCWITCRYVAQSLEALVVFEKKYAKVLSAEIIPILITAYLCLGVQLITEDSVLWALTVMHLSRLVVLILLNTNYFHVKSVRINLSMIQLGFPFFLLSLSGFLQSKTDLYVMNLVADKSTLAHYQVFTSYVFLFLLLPGFILTPYTKHTYKLTLASKRRLKRMLFLVGVISTIPFLSICYFIIERGYHIHISYQVYVLAFLYLVLVFSVLVEVLELYKKEMQWFVTGVSFLSIALNAVICFFFIPIWGLVGAMFANVISQALLVIVFKQKVHLVYKTHS